MPTTYNLRNAKRSRLKLSVINSSESDSDQDSFNPSSATVSSSNDDANSDESSETLETIKGEDEKLEIANQTSNSPDYDSDVPLAKLAVVVPPQKNQKRKAAVATPKRPKKPALPKETNIERTKRLLELHHPELVGLWEALELQHKKRDIKPAPKAAQPPGLQLKLLPFQLEGLYWLKEQEAGRYKGGILADEMGMGKTIQTIALFLSDSDNSSKSDSPLAPNLVIAPAVALMQWKNEIDLYTNSSLSIYFYYAMGRKVSSEDLTKYDIVLTTYGMIESSYRRQQQKKGMRSPIHSTHFNRVVLDEAHNIKNRTCSTSRSVFELKCNYRLCLSGTPLQNRIGELFSLLRFLKIDPFAYYFCKTCDCKQLMWKFSNNKHCDHCKHIYHQHTAWFNAELLKPIQLHGNEGPGRLAFEKVHKVLKAIMLRRTKVERADDLGLPPRVVKIRRDYFNEEELDLYTSLYTASRRKFDVYVHNNVVLNNYANIFQLITRMRQMANHPDLVIAKKVNLDNTQSKFVCAFCDELAEDAIQSRCHHIFCRACVTEYVETSITKTLPICPACNLPLEIDLSAAALESEDYFVASSQWTRKRNANILNRIDLDNWRSSTKIEALCEELYKLRAADCTQKAIVFSQFSSMLTLIGWRLRRAGFGCVKLDGTMTPLARASTIHLFNTSPDITVFLISLKAGGVALNLTEASHVFLVDPWWNPAAEWQAADRVHRLGQKRPIQITRLIIENSIESKIVELQIKKTHMIHATIGLDDAALNRLTPDDLGFLFTN